MGYVPPPWDPTQHTPEENARYRAFLVSVLGYDPAVHPRRQTRRYIWHYLFGPRKVGA